MKYYFLSKDTRASKSIFQRITKKGAFLTLKMLRRYIEKKNKLKKIYKRRLPQESEITLEEVKNKNGIYLMNKIRMLQDPYPNPYIRTRDKKKLIIKKAILKN